jgi:hypothetical protein
VIDHLSRDDATAFARLSEDFAGEPSTAGDQRRRRWASTGVEAGVQSVLSVQLAGLQHLHAALNLYAKSTDAFAEDAVFSMKIYETP